MTNYPNSLDDILTLPSVAGAAPEAVAINALREAVIATEKELGVTPKGIYSDVRTRLDILESRININTDGYYIPDGYVSNPLYLVNSFYPLTITLTTGDGYPTENRLDGSLYLRRDGYVNEGLYARRNGTWKEISTDPWVASGDLSGTYLSQTVVGIRGKTLGTSLSSIGSLQDGYRLTWNNSLNEWEAKTGFIAGGDLSGTIINQNVIGIQGYSISSIAPIDGYNLVWNSTDSQWQPRLQAIIFDGYHTEKNLRSNKVLQSPIDNTKTGIINFGSRSSGITSGATNDYAVILGGDRHIASGNFGLVVGGDSNISSGQYSSVLNGFNNTSSNTHSTILDGYSNTSSGLLSIILDGYSNTSSGTLSLVGNGSGQNALGFYSTILNGLGNQVASGFINGTIIAGNTNSITGTSAYGFIANGNNNTTSGRNSFIGSGDTTSVQSNFGSIINGLTNTISGSSTFAFIGTGSNVTNTGSHSTVLNAATATANGLHSLILNGNTNSVTANYSTIGNGNNNTISGSVSYATIIDGYSNSISATGGLIVDGYSNNISGIWSTVLNGNNNSILSRNNTILNGVLNTLDSSSVDNSVLFGSTNSLSGTSRAVVAGNNNTLTNVTSSYILGNNNNSQSSNTKISGNSNTIGSSSNMNRIFGDSNNLGNSSAQNNIFGNSNNLINSTTKNTVLGQTNIVDGYSDSVIIGNNNIANSGLSIVTGQYGKSRLFGQEVSANSRFTSGKIGEAQVSKIILTGTSSSGGVMPLQLQDTSAAYPTFVDGYSYEMSIRILVVNTSPISPNPVIPARFVFDVLAHQESGILVIDNISQSLSTPNGTSWTVSISGFNQLPAPTDNQLKLQVDSETAPFIQPTNTASSRRAIATIEWREISRL